MHGHCAIVFGMYCYLHCAKLYMCRVSRNATPRHALEDGCPRLGMTLSQRDPATESKQTLLLAAARHPHAKPVARSNPRSGGSMCDRWKPRLKALGA